MPEICPIELAGLSGQTTRKIGVAYQTDSVFHHHFTCLRKLAVATLFRGEINDDATLPHQLNHIGENQLWRRLSGNQRCSNNNVHLLSLLTEESHFRLNERLAHDLGVTSFPRPILLIFKIKHEEISIHALDLLLHLRPSIKGSDNGPHAAGGSDRRQTRNSSADDQHLGRRNLPRSGYLTSEKSPEVLRRLNHSAVTRDVGHRTQSIKFLRAGNSWHTVHRQHRCSGRSKRVHQLFILGRPDKTHQDFTRCKEADFPVLRRPHLEDDVRGRPEVLRLLDNLNPCIPISLVRKTGRLSGSLLNSNCKTKFLEVLRNIRGSGDPAFSVIYLVRNPDLHLIKGLGQSNAGGGGTLKRKRCFSSAIAKQSPESRPKRQQRVAN